MQNIFLVWLQISLVVMLSMELHTVVNADMVKKVDVHKGDMLSEARKRFIEREKKLIKERPLSSSLTSFIEETRKNQKKKRYSVRPKRSNELPPLKLYMLENGSLVQFKNFPKRNVEEQSVLQNYTIVPLVIPISYAVESYMDAGDEMNYMVPRVARLNVTINQQMFTEAPSEMTAVSKLNSKFHFPSARRLSTRQDDDHLTTFGVYNLLSSTARTQVPRLTTKLPTTRSVTTSTPATTSLEAISRSWQAVADILVPNLKLAVDSIDNHPISVKQRSGTGATSEKEDEKRVLSRILNDVEALLDGENCSGEQEGIPCGVEGSWLSDAAGMKFDIKGKPECLTIDIDQQTPPKKTGFMCNLDWQFKAETPIELSGLIHLHGTNRKDKEIASFLGECRFCEGSVTIVGHWIIRRHTKDCKDRHSAERVLSDIWRKDNLDALRKQHLDIIYPRKNFTKPT